MQNQLSLTEVNADFKNWRSNKPYSSEPVPELRFHCWSCQKSVAPSTQFKKWCQLAEIRPTRTEFIELP